MRTIWVASYPKSGNTWVRMMIANLSAKDGAPADINNLPERIRIASAREPFDRLLLIDSGLLTHDEIDCLRPRLYEELARCALDTEFNETDAPPSVQFVKAHDAYSLTPKGEALFAGAGGANGAVVIVRDPRDVAASLANHSRISIDEAVVFMSNSKAGFCIQTTRQHRQLRQKLPGWSGQITSWLDQTDIPVHLVRYEDIKADPAATLRGLLAFAGRHAPEDDIQRAVGFADFAELRQQELEKGFAEAPSSAGENFFRRGEVGAWRDELNAQQVARIEAEHAPTMRRLGYELSYKRKVASAG